MKFIIAFAFVALIAAVSCDVAHLSTKGPNGYHYPVPEGPKLDVPINDYLPPADEPSTTAVPPPPPSPPSNEYLPAADVPSNDYLPPSLPSEDAPSADEPATTATNEVNNI